MKDQLAAIESTDIETKKNIEDKKAETEKAMRLAEYEKNLAIYNKEEIDKKFSNSKLNNSQIDILFGEYGVIIPAIETIKEEKLLHEADTAALLNKITTSSNSELEDYLETKVSSKMTANKSAYEEIKLNANNLHSIIFNKDITIRKEYTLDDGRIGYAEKTKPMIENLIGGVGDYNNTIATEVQTLTSDYLKDYAVNLTPNAEISHIIENDKQTIIAPGISTETARTIPPSTPISVSSLSVVRPNHDEPVEIVESSSIDTAGNRQNTIPQYSTTPSHESPTTRPHVQQNNVISQQTSRKEEAESRIRAKIARDEAHARNLQRIEHQNYNQTKNPTPNLSYKHTSNEVKSSQKYAGYSLEERNLILIFMAFQLGSARRSSRHRPMQLNNSLDNLDIMSPSPLSLQIMDILLSEVLKNSGHIFNDNKSQEETFAHKHSLRTF